MIGLIAFFVISQIPLQAEMNPSVLSKIRDNLSFFHHLKPDERHAAIQRITDSPEEYLVYIAADPSLKLYIRIRAIVVLNNYSGGPARSFLEAQITDSGAVTALRGWAIRSYSGACYRKDPARVVGLLRRVSAQERGTIGQQAAEVLRRLDR